MRHRHLDRRKARFRTALAAAVAALMASGIAAVVPDAWAAVVLPTVATSDPVGTLVWAPCDADALPRQECGTLSVPLDHSDPTGETIGISVVRFRASHPSTRRGVLLSNPGGPGSGGIWLAQLMAAAPVLPDGTTDPEYLRVTRMAENFDVVGFDPRGIDTSAPVRCLAHVPAEQRGDGGLPMRPLTEDNRVQLRSAAVQASQSCDATSRRRLPFMTTANTAHDMALLATALHEDTITYLGYSYGTALGAAFARLHPDRLRAAVLDSNVDPAGRQADPLRFGREQTVEAERNLQDWFQSCTAVGVTRCPFGAGDPERALRRLVADLEARPLTVDPVGAAPAFAFDNQSLFSYVRGGVGQGAAWPSLVQLLTALEKRDAADVGRLIGDNGDDGDAASLLRRATAIGDPSAVPQDEVRRDAVADALAEAAGADPDASAPYDESDGFNSISCADGQWPAAFSAYERAGRALARRAPFLGPGSLEGFEVCARWPARGAGVLPQVPLAKSAPPVLVVGGRHDAQTPYVWSQRMARQLGPQARLITVEARGHGFFGITSSCLDEHVLRYLLDLRLPAPATVCRDVETEVAALPS